MLAAGTVDVPQADATRCAGVEGFAAAAALADAFETPLSSHTPPALHLHLACAAPKLRHMEWFFDHVRIEAMLFDGVAEPVAEYNHMAGLKIVGETMPQESNCVTLSDDETDENGVPLAHVDFSFCNNDRRLYRHAQRFMRRLLEAAGGRELYESSGTAHLMGGCRMGFSPADSVVDGDGRSWDVPNLWICDGSLFPTAGGVNPSMTIMALAVHIADRLRVLARREPTGRRTTGFR